MKERGAIEDLIERYQISAISFKINFDEMKKEELKVSLGLPNHLPEISSFFQEKLKRV